MLIPFCNRLSRCVVLLLFTSMLSSGSVDSPHGYRVLVFTKTSGYHHASIADGVAAIQQLGRRQHFGVDTTSDAGKFTADTLGQYDAIVFMSTSGNMLDTEQQVAFERYIQAGGGYLGIHGASAGEYDWAWYGKLVGAFFKNHPHPQKAKLVIHADKHFPVLDSLPNPWIRTDEWYNFRTVPQNVHVLISIDENSYQGGSNGADHPLVWYHDYDGGRSFYLGLGHTPESYRDPYFLKLLSAGLDYAMGRRRGR